MGFGLSHHKRRRRLNFISRIRETLIMEPDLQPSSSLGFEHIPRRLLGDGKRHARVLAALYARDISF